MRIRGGLFHLGGQEHSSEHVNGEQECSVGFLFRAGQTQVLARQGYHEDSMSLYM